MEVPGTGIRVAEIDSGLAVTFDSVAPASVRPLRAAVRRFAEAVRHGHVVHHHRHASRAAAFARRFRARHGALPSLRVVVRDVRGGAVLELRAVDASEVDRARANLRAVIGIMQRGVCPLLGGVFE